VPDEKFQIQEALLGAVAKRDDIAEFQPIKTKASTLAGFGWSTVDYEMASSSFAYCRDASVLKYELSLKLFKRRTAY
jgi:hypothetical protein